MEMASCSKPPMKQAFLKNNSISESFLSPHKVSSLSQCHCGGAQQFISLKHFSQTSRKSLCAKTHSTLRDNTPQRQIAVLLEVEGTLYFLPNAVHYEETLATYEPDMLCSLLLFVGTLREDLFQGPCGCISCWQSPCLQCRVVSCESLQLFKNFSFQKLGLDCADWTDPIYLDLARKAVGDEERMLVIFFDRIGWPTSLPTNEKEQFLKSVLQEKRKALDEYVMTRSIPLRPGAENFIDDALKEDIPVVILTAYSKNGDKMARSVIDKLGLERLSKIKIVGNEGVEKSFYGQFVFGKGVSASLDEQLAKEARKAASAEKQRIAEEVSSKLKLSVEIDTTSSEILEKVVATLRAGAEYAGLPVPNCILIAGSQSGALAAERIGMPCLVLRSSFTARAEFRSARAVMEGFGAGDLTISKLLNRRWD